MPDGKPDSVLGFVLTLLDLSQPQTMRLVIVSMALAVSLHVAWICGLLEPMGLHVPYAKAEDFAQVQRSVAISAKINISRELRDQYALRCRTSDTSVRVALSNYIESLQLEYQQLTGQRYPEPSCN